MHRCDPSWPRISQDSLHAWKRRKKEKMATARVVDRHFRGPRWQKRDISVKHLVTQPGNAPKTRRPHLTTADEVNKVWRTRLRRPQRPSPWIEAQLLSDPYLIWYEQEHCAFVRTFWGIWFPAVSRKVCWEDRYRSNLWAVHVKTVSAVG